MSFPIASRCSIELDVFLRFLVVHAQVSGHHVRVNPPSGVLEHVDCVLVELILGEVLEVVGDDVVGVDDQGGVEHVSVVGVGQVAAPRAVPIRMRSAWGSWNVLRPGNAPLGPVCGAGVRPACTSPHQGYVRTIPHR